MVFLSDSKAPAASGLCEEQRLGCKTPATSIVIVLVSSAIGLLGIIDDSARTKIKTTGLKNVCTSALNSVHKVCPHTEQT